MDNEIYILIENYQTEDTQTITLWSSIEGAVCSALDILFNQEPDYKKKKVKELAKHLADYYEVAAPNDSNITCRIEKWDNDELYHIDDSLVKEIKQLIEG